MRKIDTILEELFSHPDYVGGQIWTKDDIIFQIESHYRWWLDGFDDYDFDEKMISDRDWNVIKEGVDNFYDNVSDSLGVPLDTNELCEDGDFEDLHKRVLRDTNIDRVIK